MEEKCRNDYKNIVGEFPPWNFQRERTAVARICEDRLQRASRKSPNRGRKKGKKETEGCRRLKRKDNLKKKEEKRTKTK